MEAVQVTAPPEMRVVEVEKPVVSIGEVLVKIKYVGLCGSDLNTLAGRNPMVELPVIPEHEVSTIIEEAGPDIPAELEKGMNVTLNPCTNYGRCTLCRSGRVSAYEHNETLGVRRNGVVCEYAVLPWDKIIPAGDIAPHDCVLIEPMSVGSHIIFRGQITDNEYVMVTGCDMISTGVIVRAALRRAKIIAMDLDNKKFKLTKGAGASYVINSKTENVHGRMLGITEGFGTDVVVEAIGSPAIYVMAVGEIALTGRVVYIGYVKSEVAFQTKYFIQKEIGIRSSRNALPADFYAVVNYIKSGNCPIEKLISGIASPENASNAMEEWAAAPGKVFQVLAQL